MNVQNIFFDLDGTLMDPKQGVVGSFQYALEKLGRPVPASKELLWCIGPPLLDSFKKVMGNENGDEAQTALTLYRERYGRIGKFEAQVYDGILEVLEKLQKMGIPLYIATAKPYVFAKEICDHFQLSQFFKKIYGPSLTGELSDKGDLIAHMLEVEHLRSEHTIMIGDRKFDMKAAARNHVKTIGALYGYGSERELLEAGADYLVEAPTDIPGLIRGMK